MTQTPRTRIDHRRRAARGAVLLAALGLAVVGIWLAALAGARSHQTARQLGYPGNTCDRNSQIVDTKITDHPRHRTSRRTARFKFKAVFCHGGGTISNAKLFCKRDKRSYEQCDSPKTYRHLHRGEHDFRVKGRAYQDTDPSPDHFGWKIHN